MWNNDKVMNSKTDKTQTGHPSATVVLTKPCIFMTFSHPTLTVASHRHSVAIHQDQCLFSLFFLCLSLHSLHATVVATCAHHHHHRRRWHHHLTRSFWIRDMHIVGSLVWQFTIHHPSGWLHTKHHDAFAIRIQQHQRRQKIFTTTKNNTNNNNKNREWKQKKRRCLKSWDCNDCFRPQRRLSVSSFRSIMVCAMNSVAVALAYKL